jgi:regulator of protease activity HflC (stomatin/prohibitin superfamily)
MIRHVVVLVIAVTGCRTYQTIDTGHRGLRFDPDPAIGIRRDVLPEGRYTLGRGCSVHACAHLIDFDVSITTKQEEIHTQSQEGLALDLQLSVLYRPIVSELYELATEVSPTNYYEEVVGPEFRSAAASVFARHSYTELAANKEKIEDEIEHDVQRRTKGKHVQVTSITLEQIQFAPEIQAATRARIVGEQEAVRQRAAIEQEALRQKAQLDNEAQRQRQELDNATAKQQQEIRQKAEETELRLKTELDEKKNERLIAESDAAVEKARAVAAIAKAHADAEVITIMARAHAEENRAKTAEISPLTVQMKAYEALGQLGGANTTILMGDFSKLPTWLFPAGMMPGMMPFGSGVRSGASVSKAP